MNSVTLIRVHATLSTILPNTTSAERIEWLSQEHALERGYRIGDNVHSRDHGSNTLTFRESPFAPRNFADRVAHRVDTR